MKLLALDTSTEYCSTALWIDGAFDVREAQAGQRHSELVLGMIDDLLKTHGLTLRGLDGIAYGEGPGSFTGLRIACGVVQGLAFGADLPVLGVGTMLALAEGSGADRVVCCLDARMQEIYHAAYVRVGVPSGANAASAAAAGAAGSWRLLHTPRVCPPDAVPALEGNGWFACGNAFSIYEHVLARQYAGQLETIAPERYPHAREIAVLAAPRFACGQGVAAEHALPVYLRDKVALRIDERATR